MTTFSDLISETEGHLLGGDRDQMNQLATTTFGVPTADGTDDIVFSHDLMGIQPGAYVNVDLETMYVWSIDANSKTAHVQRAMLGTAIDTHFEGALTYVNPRFSKASIAKAINQELRSLSAPPNGLFAVRSFALTTKPVQKTYEIPTEALDFLEILEVRYQPPGAELRWPRVWGDQISVMRNMPTTGSGVTFPNTGTGFRIEDSMFPGRPMRVLYAAPFVELSSLTQDATEAGLSFSQEDIPPLGAAARLMGFREAKRAQGESAVDSRRAGEVPPGSPSRAAQVLLSILHERVRTEFMRLISSYPSMA